MYRYDATGSQTLYRVALGKSDEDVNVEMCRETRRWLDALQSANHDPALCLACVSTHSLSMQRIAALVNARDASVPRILRTVSRVGLAHTTFAFNQLLEGPSSLSVVTTAGPPPLSLSTGSLLDLATVYAVNARAPAPQQALDFLLRAIDTSRSSATLPTTRLIVQPELACLLGVEPQHLLPIALVYAARLAIGIDSTTQHADTLLNEALSIAEPSWPVFSAALYLKGYRAYAQGCHAESSSMLLSLVHNDVNSTCLIPRSWRYNLLACATAPFDPRTALMYTREAISVCERPEDAPRLLANAAALSEASVAVELLAPIADSSPDSLLRYVQTLCVAEQWHTVSDVVQPRLRSAQFFSSGLDVARNLMLTLADAQSHLDDHQGVLDTVAQACRNIPSALNDPLFLWHKAHALRHLARPLEALQTLEVASESSSILLTCRATLLASDLNRPADALSILRSALHINPDCPHATRSYVLLLDARGLRDQASLSWHAFRHDYPHVSADPALDRLFSL